MFDYNDIIRECCMFSSEGQAEKFIAAAIEKAEKSAKTLGWTEWNMVKQFNCYAPWVDILTPDYYIPKNPKEALAKAHLYDSRYGQCNIILRKAIR